MAVVTGTAFTNFIVDLGSNNINFTTHTLKVMLVNGYVYNTAHTQKSNITGELSTANGYTAGGLALTGVTFAYDALTGKTKLDANDAVWTAAGGDIGPVTGAVIYDDTATNDKLIAYLDFDTPQTAGDGTSFLITFSANGIITFGGS